MAKVALGAEKTMAWEAVATTVEVVKAKVAEGYRVIALEQHARALDYRVLADKLVGTTQPILLVVGNEVGGVDPEVLALVHDITFIPQHGHKESMNVAVATGIALFRLEGR
jgi:tRNA G18 (ribose-2'-O)-methylase SpoU